jgi:phosphatidylserine/phosphatidylglycerophosphate/cardiolipin synthase-like enzyme
LSLKFRGYGHDKRKGVSLSAVVVLALCRPGLAALHYAPAENLEHIDVALIDTARQEIDIAAYVLTDWPVIEALTRAADRGVKVRIYLDGVQFAEREPAKVFDDLAETPGVEVRLKHKTSDLVVSALSFRHSDITGGLRWPGELQDSGCAA